MRTPLLFALLAAWALTLSAGCGKYGRPHRVVHEPPAIASAPSPTVAPDSALAPGPGESDLEPDDEREGAKP